MPHGTANFSVSRWLGAF